MRRLLIVVTVLVFSLLGSAASAVAASPWWHLSSGSRPTNLTPGAARDEVQEITTTPGEFGGQKFTNFYLSTGEKRLPEGEFASEPGAAKFGLPLPTAANIRKALEAGPYGTGNVNVTEEPDAALGTGAMRYVVTVHDLSVAPIEVHQEVGTAQAKVLSAGRPDGEIVLFAENVGDANLDGETLPVKIADVLPPHLRALAIAAIAPGPKGEGSTFPASFPCSLQTLTCTLSTLKNAHGEVVPGKLVPYDTAEIRIAVEVEPGAQSGELNHLSASGGGAPAAAASAPITISSEPTPFGVEEYRLSPEEAGGAPAAAAASHPFQVTGTVAINQAANTAPLGFQGNIEPAVIAKDIRTELPPGLFGNPSQIPTCSLGQFLTNVGGGGEENACPAASAVGVSSVTVFEPDGFGALTFTQPVFNLEPTYGEPARFGFFVAPAHVPVVLDTSLRTGAGENLAGGSAPDYGIDLVATNISQTASLTSARVTFWGTPGDPRHNNSRSSGCLYETREKELHSPCVPSEATAPPPFLAMPASCAGPLQSAVAADSWLAPGVFDRVFSEPLPALDGCNQVPFSPTIHAEPTSSAATSPTGFNFDLNVEDEGLANFKGRVQSPLNKAVVTFPEGFTANPSVAAGLHACSLAQYESESVNSAAGTGCPEDSKIGDVEIESPLVTQKIHGSLFIAKQGDNPFGNLLTIYMVAKNPELGVLVKSAGKIDPNPVTGQLTTTFFNIPQLPFSHFRLSLRQGQRSPLITPATCGAYTVSADLYPWSNPTVPLHEESSFQITQGPESQGCPSGTPPFHPAIQSGMLNNNAGVFSAFYLHLTRTDGEQEISGFSTNLPAGLTGDLTGIPFCPEAAIALARTKTGGEEESSPSCPASSQVGHTLVGTGVGTVLAYVPGKIYLAGPFHGAPFSLVSVTSAVVGPFDLGTVVLRFGLNIDPYTARVSVIPTSSEPIPTILKGIVTHVRDIRVYIDRNQFTLNPTSCNPLAIGSTLNTTLGQSATITSPFQAASCANLKFAPKFSISTSGKTSKANGASLSVKLTYPSGALGSQANIARVKVDLPKQLPSRLTTLQKACTAAQFNTNPAGCPAASFIGHAKAVTPLIPVPLEGPAIFVSHGGEAFPSLIMVLQGYGVTIDLVGSTFISKSGITSSTFKTVPDQPVGSFELTLPQGKFSALAANGNLCTSKLAMPTEFLAQNGAKINQSTPVSVTGCARKKALTRAQKLAAALKACNKKAKQKRAACRASARKRYGQQANRKAKSKAKRK